MVESIVQFDDSLLRRNTRFELISLVSNFNWRLQAESRCLYRCWRIEEFYSKSEFCAVSRWQSSGHLSNGSKNTRACPLLLLIRAPIVKSLERADSLNGKQLFLDVPNLRGGSRHFDRERCAAVSNGSSAHLYWHLLRRQRFTTI